MKKLCLILAVFVIGGVAGYTLAHWPAIRYEYQQERLITTSGSMPITIKRDRVTGQEWRALGTGPYRELNR